jgi:hypothetical protein
VLAASKLLKLLDPEIRAKNIRALKYGLRGAYFDRARPALADPVFVLGCSRSGTTVTYETLAASPHFLSLGVEIPEFWNGLYGPLNNGWASEAAGVEQARPEHRDAAQRYFFQRLGNGVVLDKTCINTLRVPYLNALFPNARYVFIQRDGRDNISSMIDGWRHGRTDGSFHLSRYFGAFPEGVAINGGEFDEWHFFLPPGWREYNRASLEEVCAYQWISANQLALQGKALIAPERWIQIRYEDLFDRPVDMFRDAFERLDLPFDEQMRERCAHLAPTSIVKGRPKKQKWREHNPEAIERVLPMIRPLMKELGYDADR